MDLHSLLAAPMPNRRHFAQVGASDEDRYYSAHITQSCPRLRLLGLIPTPAGAFVLVGVTPA